MIAMGMLNDQLMVKWTGASGPVAVKTAMIGLKLAVINAPVMPKKKHAAVNHMIPKGSAVHGMMPPTVAVSSRSVICMLALKATASRTDPTIERVSVRHKLGKGIGGIGSKRPPRDRKSTRPNSSPSQKSHAVFCLIKKKEHHDQSAEASAPMRRTTP